MNKFRLLTASLFVLSIILLSSCKKEIANQPPQIESIDLVPNQAIYAPGATIQLTANATDKEGDEISYEWDIPAGGSLISESKFKKTIMWEAPLAVGSSGITVTFTAHVYSSEGGSGGDNAYKRVSFLIK